ncbi:amino acid transporter [uncultured Microbacterium sp.]|uniref:amino acid transporter n=1 Tax=uncultured Microbacterium sp. TaxID=191216 RepID=UPI0035CA3D83
MTDDKPTRRDLMKPVQLLGLAFGAALFAAVVTLISMGFFQQRQPGQSERALVVALIVLGVTFIVVLVGVALLLLVIDPVQVQKTIDRPVLYDDEDDEPDAAASGDPDPRP